MKQAAYVPVILTSLKEIAQNFGVKTETVKQWVKEGAPIVVRGSENNSRYTTELADLYFWFKGRSISEK